MSINLYNFPYGKPGGYAIIRLERNNEGGAYE